MIKASCAEKLKVSIVPASQLASQADGHTPLRVLGEVHMKVSWGMHACSLDALVINTLEIDILAGNNFLSMYDIVPRLATKEIIFGNSEIMKYNQQPQRKTTNARRIPAHLVHSPTKTVLLGDYITIPAPQCTALRQIQPGLWNLISILQFIVNLTWPLPQEIESVNCNIRIANTLNEPIMIRRGDHIGQLHEVINTTHPSAADHNSQLLPPADASAQPYSAQLSVDPDNMLPTSIRNQFHNLHLQYGDAFNPSI